MAILDISVHSFMVISDIISPSAPFISLCSFLTQYSMGYPYIKYRVAGAPLLFHPTRFAAFQRMEISGGLRKWLNSETQFLA